MMSPADHGLFVICGDWDDVTRYVADMGLDPNLIIRPHDGTMGLYFEADQICILPGWNPGPDEFEWFWQMLATRVGGETYAEFYETAATAGLT